MWIEATYEILQSLWAVGGDGGTFVILDDSSHKYGIISMVRIGILSRKNLP